jgi:hypothetical protein
MKTITEMKKAKRRLLPMLLPMKLPLQPKPNQRMMNDIESKLWPMT